MNLFTICLALFFGCTVFGSSVTIIEVPPVDIICSLGPTYWCQNLTTSKQCSAVKHCIQTVWEHMTVPEDNDDICTICKNMVKQARDQLLSNETQEELKEVFDGSCKLIPIKTVSNECCKLADEFIPELVETLASQMNPDVVCTVAGLCNSKKIDKLLEERKNPSVDTTSLIPQQCKNCGFSVQQLRKNVKGASRDDILNRLIEICGKLGSFSDSCSSVVITYFNDIYGFIVDSLESRQICTFLEICPEGTEKMLSLLDRSTTVEMNTLSDNDLTCDLCKDLVQHLKDILVANTTEVEFKQVLEGICQQTRTFKSECINLVDEYSEKLYDFLMNSLDPEVACDAVGLCERLGNHGHIPLWPLVSSHTEEKLQNVLISSQKETQSNKLTPWNFAKANYNQRNKLNRVPISFGDVQISKVDKLSRVPITFGDTQISKVDNYALPIERTSPHVVTGMGNGQLCTFCEYFLHYIQESITSPSTELELKKLVDEGCDRLPSSFRDQCVSFVDVYGDAVVALLAQEIDPSVICPKLGICTDKILLDMSTPVNDKPGCPLCLLAIQELETKLKDNKTEENIREALESLCSNLPRSLTAECQTFVDQYTDQVIEMIIADFTPQEVCVYLKLCDPQGSSNFDDILNNNVDISYATKNTKDSSECVICEFIISKLDSVLKDAKTEEEIKNAIHGACNYLPRTVSKECGDFVNKYGDLIIDLLAQEADPKEVCSAIHLCTDVAVLDLKDSIDECNVCETITGTVRGLAKGEITTNNKVAAYLPKVCEKVPQYEQEKCHEIIDSYGPSIVNLLANQTTDHEVCLKIGLCIDQQQQTVRLIGGSKCTWGPSYWCQSKDHALSCGAVEHCQNNEWSAKNKMEN